LCKNRLHSIAEDSYAKKNIASINFFIHVKIFSRREKAGAVDDKKSCDEVSGKKPNKQLKLGWDVFD